MGGLTRFVLRWRWLFAAVWIAVVVVAAEFGFGLAAAILIDVTIVRALLVPSAMKLFGKWNWWLPESVARVLRVEPSPLGHRRPTLQPTGQ